MSVNYLVEINALNDWELCHPITATAYKLMMKLYYIANRSRFPERITVTNGVLMSMIGCSEDSLVRARNQLIQTGRIDYKGAKKATPVYTIHYFSDLYNQCNNPKFAGINQGIDKGINQGIDKGYPSGNTQVYTADNGGIIGGLNKPSESESEKENRAIYIRSLAEKIAKKADHEGNVAYIDGIVRRLNAGGEEAVEAAERELERKPGYGQGTGNALSYQQHSYSEDDFADLYCDPKTVMEDFCARALPSEAGAAP